MAPQSLEGSILSDSNIIKYDSDRKFRLTLSDLAKLFEVPVPTVRSYVKKGLPHQERGELLYFDLREAVSWWRNYSSRQLKEYKSGKAAEQQFLRELVDGRDLLEQLKAIDDELDTLYHEVVELEEKFIGSNMSLMEVKGALDPGKIQLAAALTDNRRATINARKALLESRRAGLESMLRKKLPDLKSVEVATGDAGDDMQAAFEAFAEASSE